MKLTRFKQVVGVVLGNGLSVVESRTHLAQCEELLVKAADNARCHFDAYRSLIKERRSFREKLKESEQQRVEALREYRKLLLTLGEALDAIGDAPIDQKNMTMRVTIGLMAKVNSGRATVQRILGHG